jgi:two-component system phosphate regulon response regulator OmpR
MNYTIQYEYGQQYNAGQRNGHSAKIMVVDDDVRLRDLLRRYLTEQGFQVVTAESAPAMNKLWLRERYDLLVLDLMLPGEDGLSICRRLRGAGDQTPIIMLTAKGEDVDRIVGLEMGADDYLPKPFNPRELVARIGAVLRRKGPDEIPGAPSETPQTFEFGQFVLDLGTRTLKKNGETVPLTTGEFSVLKVFARHARQPLSREKLMELARGPRIRSVRPLARRADLAPAQADRTGSIEPAVHPDRLGPGLRVHP